MSYLPYMSKTYKEPRQQQQEEEEPETSDGHHAVQPASSLLNERTHNPQTALKHYKYLPHPLPTLPGPSVAQEATENELYREASRHRRSSTKSETIGKPSMITFREESPKISCHVITKIQSREEVEHPKPSTCKKTVKGSKTHIGKKKSSKTLVKNKSTTKVKDVSINMCLVETDITKSYVTAQTERKDRVLSENDKSEFLNRNELNSLKREKSVFPIQTTRPTTKTSNLGQNSVKELSSEEKNVEVKEKETTQRSVQCAIFGSAEKIFVIPPVINSLLKTLAFLLHEVNREEAVSCSSGEKKRLMTQIQLILGDLGNQKSHKEFGFNTTYSDSKRMEKLLGDLQKYIKDTYGDKAEHSDRADKIKKVYVDLKKKEMELNFLNEKLSEKETLQINEVEVKENDYKNSDITLQNKRLENEQLVAQMEFSSIELRKYQKALAEVDWDIKTSQEQVNNLKKSFITKSKTDIIGKKVSSQKFSSETLATNSRSREIEVITPKKKT